MNAEQGRHAVRGIREGMPERVSVLERIDNPFTAERLAGELLTNQAALAHRALEDLWALAESAPEFGELERLMSALHFRAGVICNVAAARLSRYSDVDVEVRARESELSRKALATFEKSVEMDLDEAALFNVGVLEKRSARKAAAFRLASRSDNEVGRHAARRLLELEQRTGGSPAATPSIGDGEYFLSFVRRFPAYRRHPIVLLEHLKLRFLQDDVPGALEVLGAVGDASGDDAAAFTRELAAAVVEQVWSNGGGAVHVAAFAAAIGRLPGPVRPTWRALLADGTREWLTRTRDRTARRSVVTSLLEIESPATLDWSANWLAAELVRAPVDDLELLDTVAAVVPRVTTAAASRLRSAAIRHVASAFREAPQPLRVALATRWVDLAGTDTTELESVAHATMALAKSDPHAARRVFEAIAPGLQSRSPDAARAADLRILAAAIRSSNEPAPLLEDFARRKPTGLETSDLIEWLVDEIPRRAPWAFHDGVARIALQIGGQSGARLASALAADLELRVESGGAGWAGLRRLLVLRPAHHPAEASAVARYLVWAQTVAPAEAVEAGEEILSLGLGQGRPEVEDRVVSGLEAMVTTTRSPAVRRDVLQRLSVVRPHDASVRARLEKASKAARTRVAVVTAALLVPVAAAIAVLAISARGSRPAGATPAGEAATSGEAATESACTRRARELGRGEQTFTPEVEFAPDVDPMARAETERLLAGFIGGGEEAALSDESLATAAAELLCSVDRPRMRVVATKWGVAIEDATWPSQRCLAGRVGREWKITECRVDGAAASTAR